MKTIILTLIFISTSTFAQTKALRILTPQGMRDLMGPYPALGTEASHQDFDVLLQIQNTRTPDDCADAAREEDVSLEKMFAGPKGPLTKKEMRIANPQVIAGFAEIGANIYVAKSTFKRPRPYLSMPTLIPCIDRESSSAYPSGHTATAWYFARKIAKIFPSKKAALLKRAGEVSWNRVIGGVHHPSDIVAGKKLGEELAND